MKVFIADDEQIVLKGLQQIINWEANGFSICGTAVNGQDTLDKILILNPDLVLLDIRMPKMSGIEVVKAAVEAGFTGKFIILSGLSDFKLAQTAMRYGVDFYLTKPIDEEELEHSVRVVRDLILEESRSSLSYTQYRDKARENILREILLNTCDYHVLNLPELHLNANIYQVVTYGNYNQNTLHPVWNFSDLMRVTNQDNNTYDILDIKQHKIILLKGDFAVERFQNLLAHYRVKPQKGSPFDSIFLTYGRQVTCVQDIHLSYQDICQLANRRFFCVREQHVIGSDELPSQRSAEHLFTQDLAPRYAEIFCNYIQSHNPTLIADTLRSLSDYLTRCIAEIIDIKHFLIDIYILVKQKIMQLFPQTDLPFLANASVIILIEEKYYLYEIIEFLSEQFEMWMHSVGYSSGENVLDEVLHYIQHNYQENLKLETLAPLFGYNSSYLGRLFSKKLDMNFNSYLDHVRIAKAKELLDDRSLKVYEIAERVGYHNVDYFHRKFKKYEGTSPAEYRKNRNRQPADD